MKDAFTWGVPNLDCVDEDELRQFALDSAPSGAPHVAATMFPGKRGTMPVVRILNSYAWSKLSAIELRRTGRIADALSCERRCESLYNSLPRYARW
jgi:hypothetical protein